MKVADMKDEDTLKKMKVLDIRKHVREFNEHYAIKGYSKVKKDQLINMVLTAQDRIKNSKKPTPKAPKAKASPKAKKASPLTVTKANGSVKELKVRTKKTAPNKKRQEIKEKLKELLSQFTDQTENNGGDELFELSGAGDFIKTLSSIKSKDKDIIELKKLVRENKYKVSFEGGKVKGKQGVGWFWDMYNTNEIYHKLNAINNKY